MSSHERVWPASGKVFHSIALVIEVEGQQLTYLVTVLVAHSGNVMTSNVTDVTEVLRLRRVTVLNPVALLRAVFTDSRHLKREIMLTI